MVEYILVLTLMSNEYRNSFANTHSITLPTKEICHAAGKQWVGNIRNLEKSKNHLGRDSKLNDKAFYMCIESKKGGE